MWTLVMPLSASKRSRTPDLLLGSWNRHPPTAQLTSTLASTPLSSACSLPTAFSGVHFSIQAPAGQTRASSTSPCDSAVEVSAPLVEALKGEGLPMSRLPCPAQRSFQLWPTEMKDAWNSLHERCGRLWVGVAAPPTRTLLIHIVHRWAIEPLAASWAEGMLHLLHPNQLLHMGLLCSIVPCVAKTWRGSMARTAGYVRQSMRMVGLTCLRGCGLAGSLAHPP